MTQQNIVELSTIPREDINAIVEAMGQLNPPWKVTVQSIRRWYYDNNTR
jgi:hypothetical protein